MIRRLALGTCVLLAAAAVSSCATFTDNRAAARVGDIELSQDDIDELLAVDTSSAPPDTSGAVDAIAGDGGLADGDEVRTMLTRWIQAALLERALGAKSNAEMASATDLEARLSAGLQEFVGGYVEEARTRYDAGVPSAPMICLAAIPVETEQAAGEAIAAIEGGMSFAEAAAEYSIDPTLASNGGVVSNNGVECAVSSGLNPVIVDALSGSPAGTPVTITLEELVAVVQQRPFDDLTAESQNAIAEASVPEEAYLELVGSTDVYVDPRYGYWDSETASVEPLGG